MLKYIFAEIYRMLHKRTMYIYFGFFALGYALLAIIQSGSANPYAIANDAENLFAFLPAIIGGYLFAALYTDDLNSKNLSTLIGFGMSKTKIVLSKLVLMVLFSGMIFGLLPLFMSGIYALLGSAPTASILGTVYSIALQMFLRTLAFATLSAIVVYGLQRATFGIVAYLLLAFSIVGQLLSMLLGWEVIANLLPGLSGHLITPITNSILMAMMGNGALLMPIIEYAIYIVAALGLSILAFHKKELEF